ncbi:MAG: hypothetical protein GXP54_09195 [Deltaproteobacteria bacterium]|nr:hypothetical protein [Deltaproteobacteria bacterium]
MSKRTTLAFAIAALGALLGLIYSGVSTADFAAHLDRQLHPVSCTLLPGLTEPSQLDEAAQGCKVALFSPYSSFWRERYWGGIPYSLPAMGVYGFALMLCIWAFASRRGYELAPSSALFVSGLISAGASLVFFYISKTRLNTVCTTCVGSYVGSALLLLGSALVLQFARADRWVAQPGSKTGGTLFLWLAIHALELGLAVVLPVYVFVHTQPDYGKLVSECERLKAPNDRKKVLLDLGGEAGATDAMLVIDPLCAACKAFHRRLEKTRFSNDLHYKVLLMPLDSECNWMLKDSMHPGSCLLSKALLCAGRDAPEMLDFIYRNQEKLRMLGIGKHLDQIREQITEKFPDVRACMGLSDTRIKLNNLLRLAMANSLPLLTPQLYLDGKRLCDEDTDLGLDFAMNRLLGRRK